MAVVLCAREVHQAAAEAALPVTLQTSPLGWGWMSALVPTSSASAIALTAVLVLGASAGLVGLFTRPALGLTTVCLLLLLAIPQRWGQGVHTHHLLWFSALLAAGPSGDALSVDAFRRRRRGDPEPIPSIAHGLPVRAAWIVIGFIYLFPGIWKLRTQGLGWALSSNLVDQMHWKWLELGRLPFLRIDHWPALVKAGGLAVLALELGFLPLVLFRSTRLLAAAGAILFHLVAAAFFFIGFASLWACFTVFVPWSRWTGAARPSGPVQTGRPVVATALVTATLLVGLTLTGLEGIENGWPFTCYPSFRHDPGDRVPVIVIEEERADGARIELPRSFLEGADGQRQWSVMWSVLRDPAPARLEAWGNLHRAPGACAPQVVRFFLGTIAAEPERRGEPARRDRLLATVPGHP